MRRLLVLALLPLAACGADPEPTTLSDSIAETAEDASREALAAVEAEGQLSREVPGTERVAIETRDGAMTLGLTSEVIFARLSDQTVSEARDEMKEHAAAEDGLGGEIARAVTGAVADGLAMAVQVPLAQVRDVRYENGALVIETEDGRAFADTRSNDEPFLEQFTQADAERFVEAFRREQG